MSDAVIHPAISARGRRRRATALALSAVLAASLVSALDVPTSAAEPDDRPAVQQVKVVPHKDVPMARRALRASEGAGPRAARAWPGGGTADVTFSADARKAGSLPISVGAAGKKTDKQADSTVRVRLLGQADTQRAGVTGLLLTLGSRAELSTSVSVDYSSFRYAGGGDFGSRLRLVRMPSCAVTTPEVAACQVHTPLRSRNDVKAQKVSAAVDLPAAKSGPLVLAAVADTAGPQGTFAASSLAPSGTWSVSGSTGSFSWSYPIAVPPVAAGTGIAPDVTLAYGSSGVDGRTSGTNNQPSWVGQGWDYTPGYIERTYRGCYDDESLPEAARTGDLCWAGQIVTMNLGGESMPLVYDDVRHTWHAASDSGAKVELLTGAANGVVNGEYWRITTIDGVQYWFGLDRGPGHTTQEQTDSAWTVPVYGPKATDPCHNPAGFAQSSCAQAWRWNLDFVRDTHGSYTAYYYSPETNRYGANKGTTGIAYTRGGTLKRIDYGLRTVDGSIYGQTVPGQVVFDDEERCTPDAGFSCDPAQFTAANASRWPDTPQDQQCLAGAVCNNHSPSFWTTKRLAAITTQYNTGAGPVTVDTYQLTQSFPSIGDPELRLDKIVRTGRAPDGTALTLPPIEFTHQLLDNRVPGFNNQPAMAHWRLTNIATDTGSIVSVTYSTPECSPGDMPSDPANNTRLCFPAYWATPYNEDPILDYFHKYVTTEVQVQDRNGVTPTQVTGYRYLGTPAWHFDDNELVKPKHRTYGQFRGYQQVEVRTGGEGDPRTLTRTTYYRGMNDDVMPGGRPRSATVPNSLGETVADDNLYAGEARETQTFDGDTDRQVSTTITEQTTIGTTATRARPGLRPLTANVVDTSRSRVLTTLAAGGTRTATTTYAYDAVGRKVTTTESGTGVPDTCTTVRYADSTTSWIRDRVSETITSRQICPAPGTAPSPVLSAIRTYYDGSTTLGAVPGAGNPTRTDKATGGDGATVTYATVGTTGYDAQGRATSVTDANQHTTRTAYTPVLGGVLSKVVATNAKSQTKTTELEPSRGLTTGTVDVGGRRTDITHDALGRTTAVWKPGRVKGQVPADTTYAYLQRTNGPLAVTTKNLVDTGVTTSYVTSVELFNAFGQLRQTQTDDVSNPNGVENRVVSDIFYDSHGWQVRTNNRYVTPGAPGTTLISVGDEQVDDRTVTRHDGVGRPVRVLTYDGLAPTRETRTVHGGDRTTVIPPEGGVTTTTIADIRGRSTEVRQYTAAPTISGDVVSGGSFVTTKLSYTPLGQLAGMTDDEGNRWSYGYDLLGRQTSASDPDSGTTTSTFDLAGRLTATKDARGRTLAFAYDELGRKTAEHSGSLSGPRLASWFYDTAPGGVGLPAYNVRHTSKGNYSVGVSRYNGAGLPTDHVVGVPAAETGFAGNHKTAYSYTSTGLLRTVRPVTLGGLPGEDVVVDYDRHGQPMSTFGYNSYVSASTYTAYGEPAQYTLGVLDSTAWLSYDYDEHTRTLSGVNLSARQAWPQVDDLRYTRDLAGNITKIVNVRGQPENGAPTRTQCFDYDALNRLAQAWTATDGCAAAASPSTVGGVDPYWTSWDISSIGLRRAEVRHAVAGGADTTTTYTYPRSGADAVRPHAVTGTVTNGPLGETSGTYEHNAVGGVTTRGLPTGAQSLTWDDNNRLASVTTGAGTTGYLYDADGSQLIRTDPGTTTLYLPMQDIVRDNATGALKGTRYYSHNAATVAMRVGGANPQYVQSDQHGTAQVTVSAVGFATTRRTFDPYGNPIGTGQGMWPGARGYLNMPHNPVTGLTDIGARKYDPSTGTFVSVDPLLDTTNPQQWNPYAYSNNNPVTHSDPTGQFCDSCNFYNPSAPLIGVNCPPCGSNPNQAQEDYEVQTGRNKDPNKQPSIAGYRVPTFDELKSLRPMGHSYGEGDTYDIAVRDWAYDICMQPGDFNAEFCSVAKDNGWLEPDNPALHEFLFGLTPISDLADCAGGSIEGCGWLLANFIPGSKGLKAVDEAAGAGKAACSFTGDTEVLMADGTRKPIEDVDVGDLVLAVDPVTGRRTPRAVTAVIVHDDTVVDLVTDNGIRVATTEDHPFWNATDGAWQRADHLDQGDALLTADGSTVRVVGLDPASARPAVAHNLTVEGVHTYYVGSAASLAVHNTCRVQTESGDWIDIPNISTNMRAKDQKRHIKDHPDHDHGGYMESLADARTVLANFHNGTAVVLGKTRNGHIIIRDNSVTGYNTNVRTGHMNQPTNVFLIKGSSRPSIVPYNPEWGK